MARNYASFINGFMGGMEIARKMKGIAAENKEAEDLGAIAGAQPEESRGFTAEQGDELRRAAESGQYDIGFDEGKSAYTVTPKADPTQTGVIAQQGVTDFMGQRAAGSMTADQVERARQNAMADVIGRRNPAEAMRMRREAKTAEREDLRFGWEQARMEREDKKAAAEDADMEFGKQLESEVGQFMQGRLSDAEGKTRPATVDDYLAATQYRAAKMIGAGKMDAAEKVLKDHAAQSFIKIQLESAERDKALGETIAAVNAGNMDSAREFYDRFLPDGATVQSFQQGKDGSIVAQRVSSTGQPMAPLVFKDTNHLTASLTSLKDPMAVYNYTQSEFRNSLAVRADQRADRAEGRAAAAHAVSMADRGRDRSDASAKAAAGVALFKENNPDATPAQLEAVRRGIISAAPKEMDGKAPSEVKLASAMVQSGLAPDMRSALEMAITKKSQSARETYIELMKPQGGISPREEDVAATMETAYGPDWKAKVYNGKGSGAPKQVQNVTEADIKATAKKHGITEAEVRRRLGL